MTKVCCKNYDENQYIENFLSELYEVMTKYKINRIFSAYVSMNFRHGIHEEHQHTSFNIQMYSRLPQWLYDLLKKSFPTLYYTIVVKSYIRKFKRELRDLMVKYNIKYFSILNPSSLVSGIYTGENQICVKEVYIVLYDFKHRSQTSYYIQGKDVNLLMKDTDI